MNRAKEPTSAAGDRWLDLSKFEDEKDAAESRMLRRYCHRGGTEVSSAESRRLGSDGHAMEGSRGLRRTPRTWWTSCSTYGVGAEEKGLAYTPPEAEG